MAGLRDIKRRIKSIRNTQHITRAMKMVSAAKLRRAQQQIFAARPYDDALRQVIGEILLREKLGSHPLLQSREGGRLLLMIIASDRGLCGGLNNNIYREAFSVLQDHREDRTELVLVGKRAIQKFGDGDWPVIHRVTDLFRDLTIREADHLARLLLKAYQEDGFDRVVVVYPEFRSPLVQQIRSQTLLPFRSKEFLQAARPEDHEGAFQIHPPRFRYLPDPELVLSHLLSRHHQSTIWRILLEAQASDHGARMTAMDNATTNAGDMLERLTLKMNRARQASITRELIEIVSGADALESQ